MQSIHSLILEFLDLGLMGHLKLCTKYECIYIYKTPSKGSIISSEFQSGPQLKECQAP